MPTPTKKRNPGPLLSDAISTASAAKLLGVSQRRVQALITAGRLTPIATVGGAYLLSERACRAYEPMPQGWQPGRPRGRKL